MGFIIFQLDVVIADLDGGSVRLPENVHPSLMAEPMLSRVFLSLRLVSIHLLTALLVTLNHFTSNIRVLL